MRNRIPCMTPIAGMRILPGHPLFALSLVHVFVGKELAHPQWRYRATKKHRTPWFLLVTFLEIQLFSHGKSDSTKDWCRTVYPGSRATMSGSSCARQHERWGGCLRNQRFLWIWYDLVWIYILYIYGWLKFVWNYVHWNGSRFMSDHLCGFILWI